MKIKFLMLFTCDSGVCNMPKDSVPIHQPTSLFSIFSLKLALHFLPSQTCNPILSTCGAFTGVSVYFLNAMVNQNCFS